ncbi:hypothetical protein CNR34_00118 [Pseudomonas phage nickie]|uniref:Uncharacterized protein n=1 Tax=Pseudomonas phage nickie TaxID=2048977 RepID=A0A2H4P7B6_9CAUD|nr:hypothetical protein FDJ16_gp047 [Pseudomonas phage nickie]ATW58051.1 hypothetical protein CNR34_00118 [Pseudomonas phage nickie]
MARLITEEQLAEIINDLRQQPGCIQSDRYRFANDHASEMIISKLKTLPKTEETE